MSDPGLNQRLRQRSRRSGLIIGLSMALTLVVCVIAFTMIYAQLEPVVSDFVGRGDIEVPTPLPTVVAEAPEPTAPPAVDPAATDAPPADDGDNQAEATEAPVETPEEQGFTPNYQISADGPVNLRPGPGVGTGDAIIALPVGTPLMYMDEEVPTEDPGRDDLDEGSMWLRFQTEDGTEGWIREVDVSEYVP